MAVIDPAERCFVEITGQLQCFGWIGISHEGYFGQVHINGYLSHGFDSHSKNKSGKMGIFH